MFSSGKESHIYLIMHGPAAPPGDSCDAASWETNLGKRRLLRGVNAINMFVLKVALWKLDAPCFCSLVTDSAHWRRHYPHLYYSTTCEYLDISDLLLLIISASQSSAQGCVFWALCSSFCWPMTVTSFSGDRIIRFVDETNICGSQQQKWWNYIQDGHWGASSMM